MLKTFDEYLKRLGSIGFHIAAESSNSDELAVEFYKSFPIEQKESCKSVAIRFFEEFYADKSRDENELYFTICEVAGTDCSELLISDLENLCDNDVTFVSSTDPSLGLIKKIRAENYGKKLVFWTSSISGLLLGLDKASVRLDSKSKNILKKAEELEKNNMLPEFYSRPLDDAISEITGGDNEQGLKFKTSLVKAILSSSEINITKTEMFEFAPNTVYFEAASNMFWIILVKKTLTHFEVFSFPGYNS